MSGLECLRDKTINLQIMLLLYCWIIHPLSRQLIVSKIGVLLNFKIIFN